ncbi:MAG: hypothetical protein WBP72_11035 [Rhodocyclaceae bacterium]
MKTRLKTPALIAVLLSLGATTAMAQLGAGIGPGTRQGMGGGIGLSVVWVVSQENTPGYALMTAEERNAHRDQMRSVKSYEECKTYMDDHHRKMQARAKERGSALQVMRADPCRNMKARVIAQ